MPMTTGEYAYIEELAYQYILRTLKYNLAVTCGILANIEAESGFNPRAVGDGGDAYGLCQWNSRRSQLFTYANSTNPSAQQQLAFMNTELNKTETRAKEALQRIIDSEDGAYNAAYQFCVLYERPSNKEDKGRTRGARAREYFTYYKNDYVGFAEAVSDKGHLIVEIAREQLGKKYEQGKYGYDSDMMSFDDTGLVFYSYREADSPLAPYSDASDFMDHYRKIGRTVSDTNNIAAGDILFYKHTYTIGGARNPVNHTNSIIAIANGTGGKIYASKKQGIVVEESSLANPISSSKNQPDEILRILSEAETSKGDIENAIDYISLTSYDPYENIAYSNLSRIASEASGYDYGYLIDMDHGGEFKFYIPEFTEQAGAKWTDVDIRGRSVAIKAYESTSSRSISISLELYAGVGVYKPTTGESGGEVVSRLHQDANFVKSLEYPDYSSIIIQPPSTVQLILGSAISLVGVVSDVAVEHLKPLDAQNRSMYIKLSFRVTQTAINPPDYRNIREGQYTLTSKSNIDSLYQGGINK